MGFHISGHMNGVWAHPLKLLDSYAFFLDGSAFPAATKFTSGPGFVQLDYPATSNGLQIFRTEFAPDGQPVALIGLSTWYAVVAGAVKLTGPQDTVQFSGASSLMENLGPLQKRASGQLSWQVTIAPGSTVNLWLAVAGTHTDKSEAYGALFFGLADPQSLLRRKIQARLNVLAQSDAQIPDPAIQAAFN
jgi:hypothetical protein